MRDRSRVGCVSGASGRVIGCVEKERRNGSGRRGETDGEALMEVAVKGQIRSHP